MAAYSINSARHPIHVITFDWSFNLESDAFGVMGDVRQMLDDTTEPIAVICDMRQMHLSIGELLGIPGFINRSSAGLMEHPMLAKLLFVTSSDLLRLATGPFISGHMVSSMEVAVGHARVAIETAQAA